MVCFRCLDPRPISIQSSTLDRKGCTNPVCSLTSAFFGDFVKTTLWSIHIKNTRPTEVPHYTRRVPDPDPAATRNRIIYGSLHVVGASPSQWSSWLFLNLSPLGSICLSTCLDSSFYAKYTRGSVGPLSAVWLCSAEPGTCQQHESVRHWLSGYTQYTGSKREPYKENPTDTTIPRNAVAAPPSPHRPPHRLCGGHGAADPGTS